MLCLLCAKIYEHIRGWVSQYVYMNDFQLGYNNGERVCHFSFLVAFYDTNEPFFCVTLFVYWLQIERKTLDGAVNFAIIIIREFIMNSLSVCVLGGTCQMVRFGNVTSWECNQIDHYITIIYLIKISKANDSQQFMLDISQDSKKVSQVEC